MACKQNNRYFCFLQDNSARLHTYATTGNSKKNLRVCDVFIQFSWNIGLISHYGGAGRYTTTAYLGPLCFLYIATEAAFCSAVTFTAAITRLYKIQVTRFGSFFSCIIFFFKLAEKFEYECFKHQMLLIARFS